MNKTEKKILDAMAAFCLLFDVDWETDFEDDEYVLAERARREENRERRRRILESTFVPAAK